MNKCKRKKQTILESFIISLERKKIASTILKNLLNMLLLYLIIIQYHIYVYTHIYIYIYIYRYYIIDFKYHISLNCSKCLRLLYFSFFF